MALLPALWWHRGDRAFQNLEQGVLDALPQILVARSGSENGRINRLLLIDPSLPRVLAWAIRVSQGEELSVGKLDARHFSLRA